MKAEKPARIYPLQDYVLIKREPREKVTPGGLIIPTDEADTGEAKKLRRGEVLAVGPGRWSNTKPMVRLPIDVKPGDVVLFSPVFSGLETKKPLGSSLPAETLLLRAENIWAVESEG